MRRYELYCADKSTIAGLATMYFIGFAISAPIVPSLSDKYGRKWFLISALLINISVYLTILCLPGKDKKYFTFIVILNLI